MSFANLVVVCWAAVMVVQTSFSSPRVASPVALTVRGPEGMTLQSATPELPTDCVETWADGELGFHCSVEPGSRLEFVRAGFEPRWVTIPEISLSVELDLDDSLWQPTRILMTIEPPELAVNVNAVWVDGDKVIVTTPVDSLLLGPRIAPGSQFFVAIVGNGVAGLVLSRVRAVEYEPIAVTVEEGSSVAAICRDPWTWEPVDACEVVVGSRPRLLRSMGLGQLDVRGTGTNCGLLQVLKGGIADALVIASAPGFPPFLAPLGSGPVLDLVLPVPRLLRLILSDADSEKPVMGQVRLVTVPEGVKVVEQESDHRGVVEVEIGEGTYEVFVEAPEYRPLVTMVEVEAPRRELRVALRRGWHLRGRVIGSMGEPLAGAVVVASTPDFSVESVNNTATADRRGEFALTLPGEPPWVLATMLEGYAAHPLAVHDHATPVTIRMDRRCEVRVVPMAADGAQLVPNVLVFVWLNGPEVITVQACGSAGHFDAQLAPGDWMVVSEADHASGMVHLPENCAGWVGQELIVLMAQSSQSPSSVRTWTD